MTRITALPLIALGLAIAGPAAADDQCRHEARREGAAPAAGHERIRIEAGAGTLMVTGRKGLGEVKARGRACSSLEELVAATDIEVRRDGNVLIVAAVLPEPREVSGSFWSSNSAYATLDLEIDVPADIPLDVEDSSGDLTLEDVAATTLADSSGDIRIRNVGGDLKVTDSSGSIDIAHVHGSLRLSDSSGAIDVEDVAGDVLIPVDSSGDLSVRRVQGSVTIETDTSGDIDLVEVRRDVRIAIDSSGSISVEDVGGDFTVGTDSSGSIRHSRVAGAVSVPD
jgi:hypothetical protein